MKLSISQQEYEKMKNQALIIDVRDRLEHQTLPCLPNSTNIPYENLILKPEKYLEDKNELIITYCNYGNRSGKVTQFLREKGYCQVFVLQGGIKANLVLTK